MAEQQRLTPAQRAIVTKLREGYALMATLRHSSQITFNPSSFLTGARLLKPHPQGGHVPYPGNSVSARAVGHLWDMGVIEDVPAPTGDREFRLAPSTREPSHG